MIKNNDIEATVKQVYDHLQNKGCTVKSVRVVKSTELIICVKIVVLQDDTNELLDKGFWPNGIYCRVWYSHS